MAQQTLQGLGLVHAPLVSAALLNWQDTEGHTGKFKPFVLPLPVSLWGRDVLIAMDVTLTTSCSKQSQNMIKRQGYTPGKGLGARLQGRDSPIQIAPKNDHKGLGFS
ncbi:endogenous retrovirus group K member 18 Pro protein-like [Erethizon dorsatum]